MAVMSSILFYLPLLLALIILIIVLASVKKLNVIVYAILAILGPIVVTVLGNTLSYILLTSRHKDKIIVLSLGVRFLLPLIYLIILLIIVGVKKNRNTTQQLNTKICKGCNAIIKPEMDYCPYCGMSTH